MATFMLIHGSWHSAWNWHLVMPLLQKAGHTVIAIDLPGMGRDKTPVQDVRMQTTVEKICDIIDEVEGELILVGHSKNGIMISQAAEYRSHKISKLVYLAAYLIPNGKTQREYSMLDTEGVLKPYVTHFPEIQAHTLQPAIYREGLYHDCPSYITPLATMLLSHEPVESAIVPLQLTAANYDRVPRNYIECLQDRAVTPYIQRKMYSELPCRKVYQLDSSHSPFFSQPEALTGILLEIVLDPLV
ncbi:MAG: alpha/beta fold hydrolase [Bacteroidetes bacterium]|nr:alpha/beta fold hydrolase [Bacteroidota bacterium]